MNNASLIRGISLGLMLFVIFLVLKRDYKTTHETPMMSKAISELTEERLRTLAKQTVNEYVVTHKAKIDSLKFNQKELKQLRGTLENEVYNQLKKELNKQVK
jgi:hypothetical protein